MSATPIASDSSAAPLVGIVMGSRSDWETMQHAAHKLEALGVPHEVRVVSAHRTPDVLFEYAATAQSRGLRAIIAGAGGAHHQVRHHRVRSVHDHQGHERREDEGRGQAGCSRRGPSASRPRGPNSTAYRGPAAPTDPSPLRLGGPEAPGIAAALEAFRQRQTDDVASNDDPRK